MLKRTIEIIEALRGGLDRRISWDEVRKYINLLTDGCGTLGFHLPTNIPIFRARVIDDGDRYSSVQEILAQDHSRVKSYGRCNRPGQSVFYGALNLETIFSELGLAAGSRVQVIECRAKRPETVNTTIVGETDHVRRYGTHSSIASPMYVEEIKKQWNLLDELSKLRINLVDAFIADRFRQEAKYGFQYKITSTFSDILFLEYGLDAFFYPSVGHLGGWNIAIKKEVADRELEVIATSVHEINDPLGYGIFGSRIVWQSTSFDANGRISYPEKKIISGFASLDELVYFWATPDGRNLLLILPTIDVPIDERSANNLADALRGIPDEATPLSMKFGKDISVRIGVNLGFEEISAQLNKIQPNWTGMIVDVVPTQDHDVAIRNLMERIERGEVSGLQVCSKNGELKFLGAIEKRRD